MKIRLGFIIFFFTVLLINQAMFAGIEISFNPNPVVAGEPASLSIQSTDGRAKIEELPKIPNLQWAPFDENSRESLYINGESFEVTNYSFTVSKPGLITIPSLKIKTNASTSSSKAFNINVTTGTLTDLDKYLFLEPKFKINSNKAYVGQEIPLSIYLYQASNINIKPLDYPSIKLDNVMFGNFNSINNQNGSFAPYPYGRVTKVNKDGIEYDKSCFYTTITPLVSGNLKGGVSIPMDIAIPNNSTSKRNSVFNNNFFDDPFLGGSLFSRSKHVSKLISADLPSIEVLPLPKIPDNYSFLGLFGIWDVKYSPLPASAKVADTLTLEIKIEGYGSLQSIKAPQLNIQGFSVYSPEIQKEDNFGNISKKSQATVTYLLVPTSTGEKNIHIKLAVFDPSTAKYVDYDFNSSIKIEKNPLAQEKSYSTTDQDYQSGSINNPSSGKQDYIKSILYLKKNTSDTIKIPLIRNSIFFIILFLILGPIVLIITEIRSFRKKKTLTNTDASRKYKAQKIKGRVLSKMMKAKDNEFINIVNDEILKLIIDLAGLPQSATTNDIESVLKDKELSSTLHEIVSARYSQHHNLDVKKLKHKIYTSLKRYRFLLVIGLILFISYPSLKGAEINNDKVFGLYNSEQFTKAIELYKSRINIETPSPFLYYNIGNCYYMENNLPKAELYYIRALLLNPRDPEVIQNLNIVLEKLQLPKFFQLNTPKEITFYIRNSLRPDQWLLLGSIMVFLIFLTLSLRRKLSRSVLSTSLIVFLLILIITIMSTYSLNNDLYSSSNAIILKPETKIYSLPTSDSEGLKIPTKSGELVKILDYSNEWALIKIGQNNGWIPKNDLEKIWEQNP